MFIVQTQSSGECRSKSFPTNVTSLNSGVYFCPITKKKTGDSFQQQEMKL